MAVPFQNLRSNTPGNVPASLLDGQLGINQADGKIYYRSANGTVTQFAAGSGSIPDPYELGTYPLITISAQPSNTTATVGNTVTLSVTATATLPAATITYQWQQSTDSGTTWANVSGATSSSLTLTSVSSGSSGYRYRCVLSANLSQIISATATLTVNATNSFSVIPSGWTGAGSVASKVSPNAGWATSKSLTAAVSGTLRITGSVAVDIDDAAGVIQVAGTTVQTFASLGLVNQQSVNISRSITAGQTVTFTAWALAGYSNWGTNLQIWIE